MNRHSACFNHIDFDICIAIWVLFVCNGCLVLQIKFFDIHSWRTHIVVLCFADSHWFRLWGGAMRRCFRIPLIITKCIRLIIKCGGNTLPLKSQSLSSVECIITTVYIVRWFFDRPTRNRTLTNSLPRIFWLTDFGGTLEALSFTTLNLLWRGLRVLWFHTISN